MISSILESIAIPAYRHSLPEIKKEISRARRFRRPLAIVAVGLNGNPTRGIKHFWKERSKDENLSTLDQPKPTNGIEFLLFGPVFRDALREIDITTYEGRSNTFIIALPETTKPQAVKAVKRIKERVGEGIAEQLSVSIAELPTDGLTIEDLILSANKSSERLLDT